MQHSHYLATVVCFLSACPQQSPHQSASTTVTDVPRATAASTQDANAPSVPVPTPVPTPVPVPTPPSSEGQPWVRAAMPPGACTANNPPTLRCQIADSNRELVCWITDPCSGDLNPAHHELMSFRTETGYSAETLQPMPGMPHAAHFRFDPPLPTGQRITLDISTAVRSRAGQGVPPRGDLPIAGVLGATQNGSNYQLVLTAPTLPASVAPVVLVNDQSLGPLRLGMTTEEIAAQGLNMREHPSRQFGNNVRMVGEYYVVLENGRVSAVHLPLAAAGAGVMVRQQRLTPTSTIAEVTSAVGNCSAPDIRIGGTVYRCGSLTSVVAAGPVQAIEIRIGPHS